jgi:predicted transcriptional regulator
MQNTLNTSNPQAITYQYEQLTFTILGGIRLNGLDSLRVTIKAEFKTYAIRHNLDLYNDSQTEKLIRKCAERFEIGTVYIGKAIGELVNQLENHRLEEIKKTQAPEIKKQISEEEKKEAVNFLTLPNLLNRTNEMIGKSGMIGEETNRLLMYLIFTSRKREHPLHIISMGSSGAGKSYLQEKIAELIPDEDKDQATSFTENSFYYQGQYDLRNKLLLIEDMDGASGALYPIRELQSKRYIIKKVPYKNSKGETVTRSIRVEGPVCIAGCTTQEKIYEDNANRSFLIYIDESKEQDERIMDYQRKKSAGKTDTEGERKARLCLQNVQRILQPITVINPYAEYLKIPSEIFKPRRSNAHYLQSIEAVTYYKQLQREEKINEHTGEVYIETTLEDIQDANELMKEILLSKSDELTGACRNYLEQLKKHLQQTAEKTFTSSEISKALRIPISTVKRYHLHLFTNGYIRHQERNKEEKSYRYEIISYEEYKELQGRVTTALDEALEKVKSLLPSGEGRRDGGKLTGSLSAHRVTEPKNKKKINHLDHQPIKPTKGSKREEKLITE